MSRTARHRRVKHPKILQKLKIFEVQKSLIFEDVVVVSCIMQFLTMLRNFPHAQYGLGATSLKLVENF